MISAEQMLVHVAEEAVMLVKLWRCNERISSVGRSWMWSTQAASSALRLSHDAFLRRMNRCTHVPGCCYWTTLRGFSPQA